MYFRTLFYHRVGPVWSLLISFWRPGCNYFLISKTTTIAQGFALSHPYSTIINAKSIGKNFSCKQLTTIGNQSDNNADRPIILNNVTLGSSVTIIGNITIGNNVIVGAGAVVVKSIPDNCVVVGNPAKIIKRDGVRINETTDCSNLKI